MRGIADVTNATNALADGFAAAGKVFGDSTVAGNKKAELAVKTFWLTFRNEVRDAMIRYTALKIAQGIIDTAAAYAEAKILSKIWAAPAALSLIASAGATAAAAPAGVAIGIGAGQAVAASMQAHDGLDFVPFTGTAILERGEMVVPKEPAAKARAMVDRMDSGAGRVIQNTIVLNGREFAKTFTEMAENGEIPLPKGWAR